MPTKPFDVESSLIVDVNEFMTDAYFRENRGLPYPDSWRDEFNFEGVNYKLKGTGHYGQTSPNFIVASNTIPIYPTKYPTWLKKDDELQAPKGVFWVGVPYFGDRVLEKDAVRRLIIELIENVGVLPISSDNTSGYHLDHVWAKSFAEALNHKTAKYYRDTYGRFVRSGFLGSRRRFVGGEYPHVIGSAVGLYISQPEEETKPAVIEPYEPIEPSRPPEEMAGVRVPRMPVLPELGAEAQVILPSR